MNRMHCANGLVFGLLTATAALPPSHAAPDTWAPFAERREVSPSGRRYVVLRKAADGTSLDYEFCERVAGAAPMRPATRSDATTIDRDPKDRLLAKGRLDQLPMQVAVADALDGFLLFERYAAIGHGSAVRWVDGTGKLRVDLSVAQLFGAMPAGTTSTMTSHFWYAHASLDEDGKRVVMTTRAHEVRTVELPTGRVATPDAATILQACATGDAERRSAMLDVAATLGASALPTAQPILHAVLADDDAPLALRLRAAVALHELGDAIDAAAVFAAGRASDDARVRDYALARLPMVLGERALPILKPLLADPANAAAAALQDALLALGRRSLPMLERLLLDAEIGPTGQMRALYAIDALDTHEARLAQVRAVATASDAVAQQALAFVQIHYEPSLQPHVCELLERGTRYDWRLAGCFVTHPSAAALPALRKAAARTAKSDPGRATIDAAIERCSK